MSAHGSPSDSIKARRRRRQAGYRGRAPHDKFVLTGLSGTADGYTVKFRLGVMDIVKTAVEVGVFEDAWRMDTMLDWVGLMFQSYYSLR